VCGLEIARREGDLWGFLYASMAFLTGLFLATMIWLVRPQNVLLGQVLLGASALAVLYGSLRPRKGLAVAIDYLVDVGAGTEEPPRGAG
jgi:hypothetical protein